MSVFTSESDLSFVSSEFLNGQKRVSRSSVETEE